MKESCIFFEENFYLFQIIDTKLSKPLINLNKNQL
ncbi:hypothetical protein ATE90_2526 [Polaribacter sp. Hel1_33_96]|nr:hypothetical protein ATE90_2526 [Polaribacter sp. Hel1_33_96]